MVGIESGAHVNVIYTGDFNGTTLDGLTILGITGDIPENLSERNTGFTISGEITASTANTITLLTSDGVRITCNTESASNESTGGLLTGSSVKVTFNPADSRQTNIYTALKTRRPVIWSSATDVCHNLKIPGSFSPGFSYRFM